MALRKEKDYCAQKKIRAFEQDGLQDPQGLRFYFFTRRGLLGDNIVTYSSCPERWTWRYPARALSFVLTMG